MVLSPCFKLKQANDTQSDKSNATVISSDSKKTVLLKFVHKAYDYWAHFIVRNVYKILIICTLFTCVCTGKVFLTPQQNIITGYTPYGSRSLDELDIRNEFFEQESPETTIMIFIQNLHGGNVLTLDLLEEIVQIDEIVRHNFTIYNQLTHKHENYDEFCTNFCKLNEPLRSFYFGMRFLAKKNTTKIVNSTVLTQVANNNILLNYPIFELYGFKINIQPSIYGVHLRNNTSTNETNLVGSDMVALMYKAGHIGSWTLEEINRYEQSVSDYFKNDYRSKKLKIMVLNPTFAQSEMIRSGFLILPAILLGFVIMSFTSISTVLLSATYFRQCSIHKVSLAIAACLCPLMASSTALGILFFAGVRFSSVLCVTPFLVLAIGLDDAYLMIFSWQRVTKEMRENPSPDDSVAHRLSLVMVETGPAILISAMTNFCADFVGSFTGSPEVTLLCVGSMASIFIDFIYQITFFTAILVLAGQFEMDQEKKQLQDHKLSIQVGIVELKPTKFINGLPQKPNKKRFHDKLEDGFQKFIVKYVNFITNTFVASFIFVSWIAFIIFSVHATSKFEQLLKFDKMVAADSPLLEIEHLRETQILPLYTTATVFVNQPGDLTDPNRLNLLNEMINEFETMPESWGKNSTFLFYRDFLNFEQNSVNVEDEEEGNNEGSVKSSTAIGPRTAFKSDDLPVFLEWPEFSFWKGFVKTKTINNHTTLDRFFFQCSYKGKQLQEWDERGKLLKRWRQIVDKYPTFKASVFNDESIFLDLIDNLPTDAWQSCVGTLICVAIVSFLFMRKLFFVIVPTIGSIMIGMLGLLSLQLTLDPVLLAAIIISIGFSIDIPGHVSYHFYSSGIENPNFNVQQRLISALSSVGFPALQASLSTALVIISLFFVPLYTAIVFAKTMYLCMALCIIHSLLILPALFSLMDKLIKRKSQS